MAEDMGDKTEAPTPRRRQEAREQGNIPHSADLTAAAILLGMMVLLNWYGLELMRALRDAVAQMLSPASLGELSPVGVAEGVLRLVVSVALALLPVFAGLLLIAVVVNVVQVGFNFNTKRLQPNVAALNPFKGIGKLLGQGKGAFSLLMNALKLSLVGLAAYSAVHGRLDEIVMVQQLSFLQIFSLGSQIVYSISMRIGVLLLVLAIVDYIFQRYRTEKQLKMTKQEVKEEMKRMEGDPQMKQRRRSVAQQMMKNRLRKDVPTADVIVTNPTEFAVALKYDSGSMHAPKVVAKGQGYMAAQIRQIAIENGIPILERKPLARALYRLVEVGQEIPEQFYSAVAEILAYVYELTGKIRQEQVA
ncbi:MAG: flagellar biosynthesis protein FlhB [Phycisphaerales bacterium]|jgi:flagellar biosynthetic protein FlhB|nr:flagellar biosynthesis protein FlhB [Phycisphaerales bacterium]